MTDRLEEAVNRGETPLALLNALTSEGAGWVVRRANKTHTDQFGDNIGQGDTYYARDLLTGGPSTLRLSVVSMERMLEAVFVLNYFGTALSCRLSKERDAEMQRGLQAAGAAMNARAERVSVSNEIAGGMPRPLRTDET